MSIDLLPLGTLTIEIDQHTVIPGTPGILYTTPVFETGDERYRWLNGIQAVAKGVRVDKILTYEIYKIS